MSTAQHLKHITGHEERIDLMSYLSWFIACFHTGES